MAIGRYVDPKRYKRAKADERTVADASAEVAKLIADMPLLPQSALPNAARIEALRMEVKNVTLPSFATPDAARYGDLHSRLVNAESDIVILEAAVAGDPLLAYSTLPLLGKVGGIDKRLGEAEEDIVDLVADVAAISTGDSILAHSALPDKAAIGALRVQVEGIVPAWLTPDQARYGHVTVQLAELADDIADVAADVAAISAGDPLLAYTALPDKSAIAALRVQVEGIAPVWLTPDAARYGAMDMRLGAAEEDIADLVADVAAISAGDPLLAYTALPDKSAIAALRAEVASIVPAWLTPDIGRYGALQYDVSYLTAGYNFLAAGAAVQAQEITRLDRTMASLYALPAKVAALRAELGKASMLDLTPDAARYGDLYARLADAEADVEDLVAAVAAITAGDPLLAYTALPDKAAIGALRADLADLAEDVAGLSAGDPLLAYTTLPDKARIVALGREIAQNAVLWHTPDAARYGELTGRVADLAEDLTDLASDVAAIAIGDPILAYSALPDKSAIAALRVQVENLLPAWGTPDTGRYGALQREVEGLTEDITGLSTTAALQAQDITKLDRTVASLHPLRAQVAGLGSRVETVEDDITDLATDLAAVVAPAVSHASSYGDLMAHKPLSISNTPECLLSVTAQDQILQVFLRDGSIAENRLTSSVNTALTAGLAAMPDKARVQYLMEEVQQLRVEIAALYSDRAKLAHLENRLADVEKLSWL